MSALVRRSSACLTAAALVLAFVACSSTPSRPVAAGTPTTGTPATSTSPSNGARPNPTSSTTPGATARASTSASASPSTRPLAMQGSIEPSCVRPGGSATLTVTTIPKAAVGYNTYYAGGKSGAEPPFGDGLGGNAGGLADDNGRYTNTWVVSPKAPIGPAHALVGGAGSRNRKGEIKVPFEVRLTC